MKLTTSNTMEYSSGFLRETLVSAPPLPMPDSCFPVVPGFRHLCPWPTVGDQYVLVAAIKYIVSNYSVSEAVVAVLTYPSHSLNPALPSHSPITGSQPGPPFSY